VGVQKETGTFKVTGEQLTTTATESTCSEVIKVATFDVRLDGESLRLTGKDGALLFRRPPKTTGTGIVEFGCFDHGNFVRGPLKPLP
jgi:hypothetical protein